MTLGVHDIYLLSPVISMASLAVLVIVLDLVNRGRLIVSLVSLVGLIIPLSFSISLWIDSNGSNTQALSSLYSTYVVDKFSLYFTFLIIISTFLVLLSSISYIDNMPKIRGEYNALVLFSATGMILLSSTVDLITIYVSLELTALPIAALAAFHRNKQSTESGIKFLILSAISSAILLYGMVIIYGLTGTTSLIEIASQISNLALNPSITLGNHALLLGVVLLIAGFGFKIAVVPFQMWAPDVYEGSPTPITAFLSVASKAAGFAVILRIFYVSLGTERLSADWAQIFAILSVLSMTIGNLVAIRQDNIKRMLAYSTVAHAGYLLVGLAVVSTGTTESTNNAGPAGLLVYLFGYVFTNLLVFSTIIAISTDIKSYSIVNYSGVVRRSPVLAAMLFFGMISLIGIPPAVGFITKLYLFGAAVEAGLTWLAVAGVLNSVLSAYYYLRVVKFMYLSEPSREDPIKPSLFLRLSIVTSFVGVLCFGIYPTQLINLAKTAISTL